MHLGGAGRELLALGEGEDVAWTAGREGVGHPPRCQVTKAHLEEPVKVAKCKVE